MAVDRSFGARAQLRDPAAFERTLRKVADDLPRIARSLEGGTFGLAKPGRGEDFYAIADPEGNSVVFGVVGDVFVVANDPSRAGRLAAESPRPIRGAEGALVIDADAEKLAREALRRLAPRLGLGGAIGGALFTRPLGDLGGTVSAEPDGLRGALGLEIE